MMELIDYQVLKVIWWLLLGIILIGFALTDGFDMGAQMLLPAVSTSDEERELVIATIKPVWEGNQVWFIVGGATFFCCLAHGLRGSIFRFLYCNVHRSRGPYFQGSSFHLPGHERE